MDLTGLKYINGIDIIYWINLDRSIDRKNRMDIMLNNIPIKNQRISAIDGKLETYDTIKQKINTPSYTGTLSEYGCLLSHLNTILLFSKSTYNIALILEDDASLDFMKYWDKSIQQIIDEAPKDWEIIMLHYCVGPLTELYTRHNGYPWSTLAYLINKKSSILLINEIYLNGIYNLDNNTQHSSDHYIYNKLITYVYKYPYFIYPDNNDSSIQSSTDRLLEWKKTFINMWENKEKFINTQKEIYLYYYILILIILILILILINSNR